MDMLPRKSPCGSLFPYPYKNGELFCLHLGSFGADENGVISRIKSEEVFFIQQNRSIGIWIDLYETKLTDRVISELIELIERIGNRILKLGLVGCSFADQWKINKLTKKAECFSAMPVEYFKDPEDAKTWLVSERW
jgi:hypothetical protein